MAFQQDHRDPADTTKKLLKKSKVESITVAWLNNDQTETMKPFDSPFGDTFDEFEKPEWDVARGGDTGSNPASYTKGKNVAVDIVIEFTVTPAGGKANLTKVKGAASEGYFTFEKDLSLKVSSERVPVSGLVSTGTLPNFVELIDFERISWSVVVDGKPPMDIGDTGPHTIYVTFDTPGGKMDLATVCMSRTGPTPTSPNCPSGQEEIITFTETGAHGAVLPTQIVTEQRLRWAVFAALKKGQTSEKECVDAVFRKLGSLNVGYVLTRRWAAAGNDTHIVPKPTLHHYLWLCNTHFGQGECHNIAAAFALACRILGVQGSFEVGYMFPLPSRQETPPGYPKLASATGSNPLAHQLGKYTPNYNDPYFRWHGGESHGWEQLIFLDGGAFANQFEGVVRYGNGLYAIGDAIFDLYSDPQQNASSYYARRGNTDASTSRPTTIDMTKGWDRGSRGGAPAHWPLVFVGRPGPGCKRPYPWMTLWQSFVQPGGNNLDAADFGWQH